MKEQWDSQGKVWAKETTAGTSGKECGVDCDVVLSNWDQDLMRGCKREGEGKGRSKNGWKKTKMEKGQS